MAKWVRATIEVPEYLKPKQRELFGEQVLNYIRKRTESGRGVGGKTFPSYSKSYINSLDFKNAEKKAGKVNLELSGDMMAAMRVLSHRKGQLTYGFENGTPENDRAEGNILGSYGKSANPKKARDFLNLSSKEQKNLVSTLPKKEDKRGGSIDLSAIELAYLIELIKHGGKRKDI